MSPRRVPRWLLVLLVAAGGSAVRAAPTAPEVQVRAAFIFNFTQFVAWPVQNFAGPEAPFVIGVLGDERLAESLTAMVKGEQVAGHPLEVRRLRGPVDAGECQIVYVSSDDEDVFREARLREAPILTIGETDDFLRWGGMIEFFNDHNHVRLRINLAAARATSLQISSKLLRVAQILPP